MNNVYKISKLYYNGFDRIKSNITKSGLWSEYKKDNKIIILHIHFKNIEIQTYTIIEGDNFPSIEVLYNLKDINNLINNNK